MAIMNRCCCCDVRTGSIVISIWSTIAGVASLIQNAKAWATLSDLPSEYTISNHSAFVALYCVSTIFGGLLLLSGICLMIGVIRSIKFLLLPYVLSQCVWILLYFIVIIIVFVLIINGNIENFPFLNTVKPNGSTNAEYLSTLKLVYGAFAGGIFLAILLDTLCVLCVISFFQQLRDGCCTGDGAGLVVNQGGYGNQPYYPGKC